MGSRTGLDALENEQIFCLCRDSSPGPASAKRSLYTDLATPAHYIRGAKRNEGIRLAALCLLSSLFLFKYTSMYQRMSLLEAAPATLLQPKPPERSFVFGVFSTSFSSRKTPTKSCQLVCSVLYTAYLLMRRQSVRLS